MARHQEARNSRGVFLTFEGVEGCGKSSQIRLAKEYLEQRGVNCLVTRQPGGTEFGLALRQVLLRRDAAPRAPMSELLIYLADRYQHIREVIEPGLAEGRIVLCDRYHDATRAYQGAARGVPPETIDALARILEIPEPNGTILLDVDPEVGLSRARQRNESQGSADDEGKFEDESISFHQAVRSAYLQLSERWPRRIRVVDGLGTIEEVFARVIPLLEQWVPGTRTTK